VVTLSIEKDKKQTESFFLKADIPQNENSSCLVAKNKDEILGYSLFDLDKEKIIVRYIHPLSDIPLADGILRSTLHIAAERFVMNAFYADTLPEDFLEKIGFIKEKNEKRLDIDKLFKSCCSCGK